MDLISVCMRLTSLRVPVEGALAWQDVFKMETRG